MSQQHHPTKYQQLQQQLSSMALTPGTEQTTTVKAPLRRATYVHVSDLTSAYNIDHAKLEQELSRVNAEREAQERGSTTSGKSNEDDAASTTVRTYASTLTRGSGKSGRSSQQQHAAATTSSSSVSPELTAEAVAAAAVLDDELAAAPVVAQKRLQPPRGGFNLCVLVGSVKVVVDKRRVDESRVRLAEVEVGDETGTVSLRARDDQIDVLQEISARSGAAVLRNSTIELYQGKHIRLAVTKWGKLSPYPDNVASTPPPPSKINPDRNYSLIDLSIVATEMVENPLPETPSYSSSRPQKGSEDPDHGATKALVGSTSGTGSRTSSSKGGQFQGKPQQHPSRKGSGKTNERRQSKGKGSPTVKTVPLPYAPVTASPPVPVAQPRQVVYQSLPGYSAYDPNVDMRQYHYSRPPPRHSDVISAQQLIMQQQFELQQRQLHQLYSQQQHDRHGHPQRRHAHPQHIHQQLSHDVVGANPVGRFDHVPPPYSGEPSAPQHQTHYPPGVVSSPMMVPMGVPGSGTMSSTSPSEQYPSPGLDSMSHDMLSHRSTGTMSPFPLGRMNPDATSYAPTYLSVTQGGSVASAPHGQADTTLPHFPYDFQPPHRSGVPNMYQPQSGQHGFYSRAEVPYDPRIHAQSHFYEGDTHTDARRKPNPSDAEESATADTSPQLSGKENFTSS